MATIDSVVKIEIKRQTNQVTVRDLETILVLTEHTRFTEDYRIYESTTDMLEDGFVVEDNAFIAAQLIFSQDPRPSKVVIGKKLETDTYVEAIVKQQAAYNKFLYVITDATSDTDKEAIATYVESQPRMIYVFSDSNAATLTTATTDIFSVLKAKSFVKSFGIYTKNTENKMLEAAYVARFSAEVIGSAVWLYKPLTGVTADTYSTTEETNLIDKNANMYTNLEDEPVVYGMGKTVGGEWIDVILGVLWIEVRMGERIWGLIKNVNKISYTNAGLSLIEIKMREVLDEAVSMSILTADDEIKIKMPNANDIPSSVRNTRIVDGITFEARLDGAIIKVDGIVGTVYP